MSPWHLALIFAGLEQNFTAASSSMQPTLPYGSAFPATLTHNRFTGERIADVAIGRGDIVLYHRQDAVIWVHRVVGLPGDAIRIERGRLYLNGELVERESVGHATDSTSVGESYAVERYRERLDDGATYEIQEIDDEQPLDNVTEVIVPAGELFVIGDSRDRSADSRLSRHGTVAMENVVAVLPAGRQIDFWSAP